MTKHRKPRKPVPGGQIERGQLREERVPAGGRSGIDAPRVEPSRSDPERRGHKRTRAKLTGGSRRARR